MIKRFLLGINFLLLVSMLSAQTTFFGHVTFGQPDGPPIPEWPVELISADGSIAVATTTNADGFYEMVLEVNTTDQVWTIATTDICNGDVITTSFDVVHGHAAYEANLIICEGIDPPPPTDCEAFFYWEQIPGDVPYLVHFFDISSPGGFGIFHWEWSFGDGHGSNERNPTHIYAEPGEYEVTLTISGEDCTSTVTHVITVHDETDCECPTDEYIPVCVYTASGQLFTFTNACYAECAGYTEDQYFLCDGNQCGCPDFYAPVCVTTPDGTTQEFQNHCFAECEGYGPDHWMDCEDDCHCPDDLYDPVCVVTPFGHIIEFANACLAECAGFEPGQYQPCDGGCVCPEFYDPVCVTLDDGTVLEFSNYCFAQCEGYGPDSWEDCEDDCHCPEDLYDPVCVATPGGIILTFINPCEAECEGYGPDVYYHCDGGCHCPEYYQPVCVVTSDGAILTFDNPCFAECEGYGPDQYFDCDHTCNVHIAWTQTGDYTVEFAAESTSEPISYEWNFGDGHTSNEATPVHEYPNSPGIYLVQLTTINANGCLSHDTEWIYVGPECYAIIIALPLEGEPQTIAFGAIATGDVISWAWTFGDDHGSLEPAPVHTYSAAGTYIVTLTITTADGCIYTATLELEVGNGDCICPDVYDPVCVVGDDGQLIEFGNSCEARCAGYSETQFVSCHPDCVCPAIWDPVCVAGTAGIITFPNACHAICEGFSEEDFLDHCEPDCPCPDVWDPVCVLTGSGQIITFGNACEAACFGYEDGDFVPCDPDCVCDDVYDPVCVTHPILGVILHFDNPCYAACAGYGPDDFLDECPEDCICTDEWDPVCVVSPDGVIITFGNPCEAECEGYGPDDFVDCEDDCICPEIYAPVCVIDPTTGDLIEFVNACYAECAGYGPDQFTNCEDDCICTDEWDPVCVVTEDGVIITFGNPCEAACFGYDDSDFVDCEDDCVCPQVYAPVCVFDSSTGEVIEFVNSCYAECAGYGHDQFVDCAETCMCPPIWDPVCVAGIAGLITFPNACEAECEGFGPDDFVDCEDTCHCSFEWDPVCVATASGDVVTFPNACIAECEGYGPDAYVDCPDCICDDYYLPVCVIDPATGEFLMFNNPCEAACAGYGADSIFPCDDEPDCHADFSFEFSDDTGGGYTVLFTDQSVTVDAITSWHWDFGDGHTSSEQNPVHTYTESGVYHITLTIESPDCGLVSTTHHICIGGGGGVGGPDCQSFFFFEQPDPTNLLFFQFIDFSLGEVDAWAWDFGDGHSSTEQNPSHTYAAEGNYVVSLTVYSDDCESSIQISVTAGENVWYGDLMCRAWFLPIINSSTLEVYFINLSSSDAVDFNWDFGDGHSSSDPIALHAYSAPGTYTVTLTIVSEDGCTNSFSSTITLGEEGDGFTSNPVFSLINGTAEAPGIAKLLAAPNPTTDWVNISWDAINADDYNWQLFDLNGRLLKQQTVVGRAGTQKLDIDLSQLPAGIYLFRLQTKDGQQSLRLSKL